MPHLETASLGVWVGSGSRDERPTSTASRISSSTWRSRARGAAPPARSPRRSRRSAAISMPPPASKAPPITRACSRPTCRSRSTCCPTSCRIRPSIPRRLLREQNVIVQEIGAVADTPDDLVFEHLQRDRVSGPAARPLDPRHARRRCARSTTASLRDYLSSNYRAPDIVVAAAGAVDHAAVVAEVEKRFAGFNGPAAPAPEPAQFGGGSARRKARARAGPYRAGAARRAADRSGALSACRYSPAFSAAACRRGCFRRRAKSAACAIRSIAFHMPYSDIGMFGLYAGTDAADAPS